MLGCGTEDGQEQMARFSTYYELKAQQSDERWNYLADTLYTWFETKERRPIKSYKDKPKSGGGWAAWDRVMRSETTYDSIWFDATDNTVKGFFYENNDFYELIGKPATKTLRTYWFDDQMQISEVLIYWIPEENTTSGHFLKPIVIWAQEHDSAEISYLYADEEIKPSAKSARRWKELLERYREFQDSIKAAN